MSPTIYKLIRATSQSEFHWMGVVTSTIIRLYFKGKVTPYLGFTTRLFVLIESQMRYQIESE